MAASKPPVSRAAKPPAKGKAPAGGDGKKILGVPRKVAVFGGIALAAGVAFFIWRSRQASSASDGSTATDTSGSAPGDTSGIQGGGMQGATGTETLVIKIRELQGHKKKPAPGPKPGPRPKPKGRGSGGPPRRKTGGPPLVGRGRGRKGAGK